jgi:hypothetical protein
MAARLITMGVALLLLAGCTTVVVVELVRGDIRSERNK